MNFSISPTVVWAVISLVGLIYSLLGLREALADWAALSRRRIRNGRRRVARDAIILHGVLATKLAVWLGLGLLVMADSPHTSWSLIPVIVVTLNIALSVVVAVVLYYSARYLLAHPLSTEVVSSSSQRRMERTLDVIDVKTDEIAEKADETLQILSEGRE